MSEPSKPTEGAAANAGGFRFTLAHLAIALVVLSVVFAIAAAVKTLVNHAREAARASQCHGHMAQIAMAMHNYHDVHGCFPPAYTTNEQGERLHSWRVLILPYLEQGRTFDRIDLSKPWNSRENLAVEKEFPRSYQCPSRPAAAGMLTTDYVLVVGPKTLFPDDRCLAIADVKDEPDQTIMIVEAASTKIHWMEPRDMTAEQALEGLRGYHPSGATIGTASGRYQRVDPQQPPGVFTIDGGEDVKLKRAE